jgi:hypothetical protein
MIHFQLEVVYLARLHSLCSHLAIIRKPALQHSQCTWCRKGMFWVLYDKRAAWDGVENRGAAG